MHFKENPVLKKRTYDSNWDGSFTKEENISCIVMCKSGEYYFGDDIDLTKISAPNIKKFEEFIEDNEVY